MSKIYLVYDHALGDYCCMKMYFSSKEKAQKYINLCKENHKDVLDSIVEIEMDSFDFDNLVVKKAVVMDVNGKRSKYFEFVFMFERLKNGKLKNINNRDENIFYNHICYEKEYEEIQRISWGILCFVDAKYDEQEAIKIANEKRVQFLLNNNR